MLLFKQSWKLFIRNYTGTQSNRRVYQLPLHICDFLVHTTKFSDPGKSSGSTILQKSIANILLSGKENLHFEWGLFLRAMAAVSLR